MAIKTERETAAFAERIST